MYSGTIVFRGQGQQLCAEERTAYCALSALIAVYFQLKARVYEQIALLWLEQFILETGNCQYEKLLGMDRHGPQMTTRFQERCIQEDIIHQIVQT